MTTDFPTAPLAPGLKRASGGTVEKSPSASHTEILTLPFADYAGDTVPVIDAATGEIRRAQISTTRRMQTDYSWPARLRTCI